MRSEQTNGNGNRRDFLKALVGGSAVLATAQMPSLAKDDPSVFPLRGTWERMSVSYARIDAGATKPFSLFHISDTHLTAAYPAEGLTKQRLAQKRTQTFGGRQEEALRDSLAWAKAHSDFLLHTGDLLDWQSVNNFDLAWPTLEAADLAAIGNHEYSPDMWMDKPACTNDEAFKALTRGKLQKFYDRHDVSFAAKTLDGVNFITLDDVYGTVTSEQVERFRAEVKKGLPIVLCMHVPFFTESLWMMTRAYWSDWKFDPAKAPDASGDYARQLADRTTAGFIAYLKTEPLLKGILSGHLHFDASDRFSPTAVQHVVGGNYMFHGRQILFC